MISKQGLFRLFLRSVTDFERTQTGPKFYWQKNKSIGPEIDLVNLSVSVHLKFNLTLKQILDFLIQL